MMEALGAAAISAFRLAGRLIIEDRDLIYVDDSDINEQH